MSLPVTMIPRLGGKEALLPQLLKETARIRRAYQIDTFIELFGGGARLLLHPVSAKYIG